MTVIITITTEELIEYSKEQGRPVDIAAANEALCSRLKCSLLVEALNTARYLMWQRSQDR